MSSVDRLFLLRELVKRDFFGRYAGSSLGVLWTVLQPLWMLALYTFVFSKVMKFGLGPEARTESFAIFLFAALIPWTAVNEGISRSVTAITDNAALVKKMNFPPELLVITVVLGGLLQSAVAAVLFLAVLATRGEASFPTLYALLLCLPIQAALTLGLGFLVAALNVYFRDIGQVLPILLQSWFFLTPIVYPFRAVPDEMKGFVAANPMTAVAELYRFGFLGDPGVEGRATWMLVVVALAVLAAGYGLFRALRGHFADEI